jgi:hypothetical protein
MDEDEKFEREKLKDFIRNIDNPKRSLVTTELDGLANSASCRQFTYDNSSNLDLCASVTVKFGSITPSSGGSITLRVVIDGSDEVGDFYTSLLLAGASSKTLMFPMVRLYPFSIRFSIINNSGVSFNAADNDVYIQPYHESTV